MARYIDADVFKKKLAEKDIFFPALYENELNETPTADVVEVVRCKDCKRAMKMSSKWGNKDKYLCDRHKSFMLADDFCSYGEKAITEIEHNSLCETKTYKRSDT